MSPVRRLLGPPGVLSCRLGSDKKRQVVITKEEMTVLNLVASKRGSVVKKAAANHRSVLERVYADSRRCPWHDILLPVHEEFVSVGLKEDLVERSVLQLHCHKELHRIASDAVNPSPDAGSSPATASPDSWYATHRYICSTCRTIGLYFLSAFSVCSVLCRTY